jgi:hypothetical protein
LKYYVPVEVMQEVEVEIALYAPLGKTLARFDRLINILKGQGMKMIPTPDGFFYKEKPEPHIRYMDTNMMCEVFETPDARQPSQLVRTNE